MAFMPTTLSSYLPASWLTGTGYTGPNDENFGDRSQVWTGPAPGQTGLGSAPSGASGAPSAWSGATAGNGATSTSAVPAGASYTQQDVTNYLDPNNRQGYGDAQFLNNLGTSFAQSTGRLPTPQDQLYYEQLYQSGADPAEIFKNIGLSPEASAFGSSGQTNPYAGYVAGQPGLPAAPTTPVSQDASFGFGSNPYLGQQSDAIRAQQAQLFGDMNNQIRSNSVATGGLGGTREGVAQGVAMGRAATGLDSALAGMYGNAYDSDQNRALSQYGMDQNFYTAQRGQDIQGAMAGGSLYNMGTQGQWSPYQNYSGTLSPYTGFGQTTSTGSSGGGASGAVGGALGTYQLGHAAGWW